MKLRFLFIIIPLLAICYSCEENNPTEPEEPEESVSYDLTDLVGIWTGEANNYSNTISLDLTVDSQGKASGSGVSSQWSIDSEGKVTGGGDFWFTLGGLHTHADASWSLQLDSCKTDLSGKFDVKYSELLGMDVNLTKQ